MKHTRRAIITAREIKNCTTRAKKEHTHAHTFAELHVTSFDDDVAEHFLRDAGPAVEGACTSKQGLACPAAVDRERGLARSHCRCGCR